MSRRSGSTGMEWQCGCGAAEQRIGRNPSQIQSLRSGGELLRPPMTTTTVAQQQGGSTVAHGAAAPPAAAAQIQARLVLGMSFLFLFFYFINRGGQKTVSEIGHLS